jgi:cyclase
MTFVIPRRIVARLDIKGPNVIKGVQFEGLRIVGSPKALAQQYCHEGADEVLFIDTVASLYGRENLLEVVKSVASEVSIPMTVGGGVRTIDDASKLLRSGADKVAINSGAIRNPNLITELAECFGSQCIVLSIEAKKISPTRWVAYIDNGREPTLIDVLEWCSKGVELGSGEILLTSVDRDGTRQGFDSELIMQVSEAVNVPVIGSGGAGTSHDVVKILKESNIDGVALASVLHYKSCDIQSIKAHLRQEGIPCR